MISESNHVLSSNEVATIVGTNASYIRKVIALLKSANLIESHQGKIGYKLSKSPKDITLLDIYYAMQEISHISLFSVHKNTNVDCSVEKYECAVSPIFSTIEKQLEKELSHQMIDTVIENLYQQSKHQRM